MYRAFAFLYCLVCHMFQVCTSKSNSTLCRLFKVLPSPLLVTARLNEEEPLAWPVSTLRSSRQPTVTASSGLLSQKNAFSISSPDLRELLWTPTVFSGLLVCIVQSFVVFLSTVTLCVHRACPCQRRSPFLSAHFIPFFHS